MAPLTLNPTSYQVLGTLRLGRNDTEERLILSNLVRQGLLCDKNRHSWVQRQKALTKLRYGLRPDKTFPWKGASNLHIPFIDHAIRKYKPILMRLITEPDPITEFVGTDSDSVQAERLAEITYNWLFKTEMDAVEPMAYVIDTLCHRGFAFAQVGWEYESEYEVRILRVADLIQGEAPNPQQILEAIVTQYDLDMSDPRIVKAANEAVQAIQNGAQFVKIAFRHTVCDRPALWDRDPMQILAPPRTTDHSQAEWIYVQHVFGLRKLKQLEADKFFLPGTVQSILLDRAREDQLKKSPTQARRFNEVDAEFSSSLWTEQTTQDEREKIWGTEDDENILIWECYHWHDINNDGLAERTVTYVHPRSLTKCRCAPFAYPFRCWPIVKFDFEKTTRRYHSPRGITQMLMDLQLEINAQHNARIDGMALRNAPAYQIPVLGGLKARNFRIYPGAVIQTPSGAQLQPLVQDRSAFPEQVAEENLLRTLGEHYIGIFDAAITSPMSQTKARTATEISAIVQYTAATSTLDAILFQLSMRKLHFMIWTLYMDLAPQEILLPVAGLDPDDPDAKFFKIRKADINKKFRLIPTGTVANTNRALELSNAREAIAMYVNDQTGFINQHQLRAWHLGLLTQPRWTRRILNSPQQAMELQILQQAALALQQNESLRGALASAAPVPREQGPRQEIAQSGQSGYEAQQP